MRHSLKNAAIPYTPLILRIGAVVLALGVGCRTARGQEPRATEPRASATSPATAMGHEAPRR